VERVRFLKVGDVLRERIRNEMKFEIFLLLFLCRGGLFMVFFLLRFNFSFSHFVSMGIRLKKTCKIPNPSLPFHPIHFLE